MEFNDIRGKPDQELSTLLDSSREELWKMRFAATTEAVDAGKIRAMRRRIAWIQTEIHARSNKATREKLLAELAKGDRTTRELATALGRPLRSAQTEALRLVRAGEAREIRRSTGKGKKQKNAGARAWVRKGAAPAPAGEKR